MDFVSRDTLYCHHLQVGDSSTDSLPEVGECRAADPGTGHVGEAAISSPTLPSVRRAHSGIPEISTNGVSTGTSPSSDGWTKHGTLDRDDDASGTRHSVASRFAKPLLTRAGETGELAARQEHDAMLRNALSGPREARGGGAVSSHLRPHFHGVATTRRALQS